MRHRVATRSGLPSTAGLSAAGGRRSARASERRAVRLPIASSTVGALAQLNAEQPPVRLKLELLEAATPAQSAVVYGDMWMVEGAYTLRCLELGCASATLIDTFETPNWQRTRLEHPELEFVKGDFADALFMGSVRTTYELGVAYDVLLHQASLLGALHLMCERVQRRFLVVQPMLRDGGDLQGLVYLPGLPVDAGLHPAGRDVDWMRAIGPATEVNTVHWLWAMTPSFLRAALRGEGFNVILERETEQVFPNPRWTFWGCIAERVEWPALHWSEHSRNPGLRSLSD